MGAILASISAMAVRGPSDPAAGQRHGLWARVEAATARSTARAERCSISERGLISSTEPADDTALQNSQRRERRLQYIPYLWAALTRAL